MPRPQRTLWHVNKARPLTVNETWIQDFCWSYWGREALSVLGWLSWWEVTLRLPATMCHKGLRTGWRYKRKQKPGDTAGGPGSCQPKANPIPKTSEKVIRC